jgi:hypothetical protein
LTLIAMRQTCAVNHPINGIDNLGIGGIVNLMNIKNYSAKDQAAKIRNAEIMFGTGSRQHLAAIKRFSK